MLSHPYPVSSDLNQSWVVDKDDIIIYHLIYKSNPSDFDILTVTMSHCHVLSKAYLRMNE